ncbi:MAG: TetR/AcrR family transcriptional regulator [Paenibacillus macerans]|uniref:Bacterial regulatory s, tetR family protein n=2 Tax=Paenibacillus macerans TaxID=44252 RepID=A0A090Z5L7_PAEMA|nr:TetR/AcrR family transcriptional regulator [Paenibacillus macerans]KFN05638.1 bacterial regulatory s, tetR family protein [Paenibacillus macerans]MBS5910019.1 TetR/AcrR family transcriptional regulator [Paenibacillus macerans]MCY7558017.1 TetR/AcrR family transcriptional regulator [Paenibacillus macerans]MDU7472746.1 TetR/AcrR family transcriptional regulator [Paenibacillus macerans]MEC0135362.1 TetR/AcrR family transcriptional regulator [Paenibacillus macerans]
MAQINRREMVIEAAVKCFSLFGYKATTMDQVAKIANVAKGTIYTFFSNKEELFDEILRSIIAEMKRLTAQKVDENKPFFENLFQSMDALLEFRSEHELLAKLFQEVRNFGTQQAREGLEKIESAILDYLERQITLAGQRGEIHAFDPKVISFVMLKLYIALTLDWNKNHEPLEKERIKESMRIFLAGGLSAERPRMNH